MVVIGANLYILQIQCAALYRNNAYPSILEIRNLQLASVDFVAIAENFDDGAASWRDWQVVIHDDVVRELYQRGTFARGFESRPQFFKVAD